MSEPRANTRSASCALALVTAGAALLATVTTVPASAADPVVAPTVLQCLAASDASLKAANDYRLRAERAQLLVCAMPSCPGEVRNECLRRVEEVNRQIPTVVFSARDESGADLGAIRVTVDHEPAADQLAGRSMAVDPGEHELVFETPGRPSVKKKLVIVQGQKDRAENILFSSAGAAPALAGEVRSPPSRGTQRWLGLGIAGVGVVGLGIGTAFGIVAVGKKSDALKICPDSACPTSAGVTAWSDAAHAGTVSTVGFIAGGVLLAGGAVLWLTAPKDGDSGVRAGIGPGQLRLEATF